MLRIKFSMRFPPVRKLIDGFVLVHPPIHLSALEWTLIAIDKRPFSYKYWFFFFFVKLPKIFRRCSILCFCHLSRKFYGIRIKIFNSYFFSDFNPFSSPLSNHGTVLITMWAVHFRIKSKLLPHRFRTPAET